ncbi:hypothetical protein [Aquimarina brevivitae]|uniref:Uncharacterized protein n=1 Tax=Aquimarina brevivitae TaxID=323412 RepID=A0A4Q7PF45_9FLAO|nr:hypothetical protein [Aquimarina brevivitae]RZS98935.1 hypothetical protein EV197_0137 [Aquimarina brevivitae]
MKTKIETHVILNKSRITTAKILSNIFMTLLIVLLVSCKSDDDTQPFEESFDGEALQQAIQEARAENVQSFAITAETGGEVQGEEGTILSFGPNAFEDQNGNPVTGSVTIELLEVYDKSKMVLAKLPTNGKRPDGTVETLKSGGEFFINATQAGENLTLATNFMLFAPAAEFDEGMQLFNGVANDCPEPDVACDVVWEEEEQGGLEPMQREGPDGQGVSGYGGFLSNFGWTNIDRWFSDPRPKTTLYVNVPEGFDDTNCNVYVSYDGEPTALALLDIYNTETELFSEHYGQIPIGLEVHIIFVSIQDDQYVYAIQPTTIEEDHTEVITETSTATEAELVALINDLP